MSRYALPLKTLGDALFLRNRVVSRLEHAELQPNAELRRWLLTFVVIGGGFSGVEVAGELVDFLRASLRFYPNIRMEDIKVVLVHGTDRLLPELTASLGDYALRQMQMDGLDIRLNARVVNVDDGCVELGDGMRIRAGTVVCTIGTKTNTLLNDIGLPMERGRIATAPDMSVPQFPGVWAIGDCAAVPNAHDARTAPPTAQFAVRQARQVAANICAKLRDATDEAVFVSADGSAVVRGPQPRGRGSVRTARVGIRRLADVARRVSAESADARAQGAAVPRMELGDVLSAGSRALQLPADAAQHLADHKRCFRGRLICSRPIPVAPRTDPRTAPAAAPASAHR